MILFLLLEQVVPLVAAAVIEAATAAAVAVTAKKYNQGTKKKKEKSSNSKIIMPMFLPLLKKFELVATTFDDTPFSLDLSFLFFSFYFFFIRTILYILDMRHIYISCRGLLECQFICLIIGEDEGRTED